MRRFLLMLALTGLGFSGVAVADVSEPDEGPVANCGRERTSGQGSNFACFPWLNPYSR
ncbi:MAG: hypothetical protein WD794_02015 [Mycobacteriales bacterium]